MNVILAAVLILTVFVVLKFSKLPTPSFFPKFFVNLFERPAEKTTGYEVLRILENLSLAYLTALLIFFLIEFIPQKRLEEKAFAICQAKIVDVYLNMSEVVGSLKMLFDIKKETEKIRVDDLKGMDNYYPHLEKTYYNAEIYLSDIGWNGQTKGIFLFHKDMSQSAQEIERLIGEIGELPSSTNLPQELIEILSSIRSCALIEEWDNQEEAVVKGPYQLHEFGNKFYDFIQLYIKLGAYEFRKHSYVYTKMDGDEIQKIKKEKRALFNEIKNISNKPNYKFYHSSIEYRIEDGQLVE